MTERRYIGEPCGDCGTRTRIKSNYACVRCVSIASARWKRLNKDKVRAWPSNNSARAKASRKAWAARNPDYFVAYYASNGQRTEQ